MKMELNSRVIIQTEKKIYKSNHIGLGAFLGGPLVGAYMIAHNYRVFNQPRQAVMTWVICSLILVALFVLGYIFRDLSSVTVLPAIAAGLLYQVSTSKQKERVNEHIATSGAVYNFWRVAAVTVIGIAIILAPIYAHVILFQHTTKAYVNEKNTIEYFSSELSESEVDSFADFFTYSGYFDNELQTHTYITKEVDTYEIYLSVNEMAKNNQDAYEFYGDLLKEMQGYFYGKRIVFLLCLDGDTDNIIKRIE